MQRCNKPKIMLPTGFLRGNEDGSESDEKFERLFPVMTLA